MTTNQTVLSVRIPTKMAADLKRREQETMVPVSRFVRSLIEQALGPTQAEQTAAPIEYRAPLVLTAPQPKVDQEETVEQ